MEEGESEVFDLDGVSSGSEDNTPPTPSIKRRATTKTAPPPTDAAPIKKRGRPKKVLTEDGPSRPQAVQKRSPGLEEGAEVFDLDGVSSGSSDSDAAPTPAPPKKRGRPPKAAKSTSKAPAGSSRRGRPPNIPPVVASTPPARGRSPPHKREISTQAVPHDEDEEFFDLDGVSSTDDELPDLAHLLKGRKPATTPARPKARTPAPKRRFSSSEDEPRPGTHGLARAMSSLSVSSPVRGPSPEHDVEMMDVSE